MVTRNGKGMTCHGAFDTEVAFLKMNSDAQRQKRDVSRPLERWPTWGARYPSEIWGLVSCGRPERQIEPLSRLTPIVILVPFLRKHGDA